MGNPGSVGLENPSIYITAFVRYISIEFFTLWSYHPVVTSTEGGASVV